VCVCAVKSHIESLPKWIFVFSFFSLLQNCFYWQSIETERCWQKKKTKCDERNALEVEFITFLSQNFIDFYRRTEAQAQAQERDWIVEPLR